MSELPDGWAQVPLAAITGEATQRVPSAEEVVRYIDIGSVNRNTKAIETPQAMLGKEAPSRARKQVAAGDTLVSMTRPNLNAVALVGGEFDGQIASTGFDVLRPHAGIDPRWISYLVRTEAFVEAMSALVQGALYPAVRSKDVRAHIVPLAPEAEQTRIANQLDTLLTRIQSCNDRFDAIPALLKRFRQTVTNAACSGELSAEWRGTIYLKGWKLQTLADVCNSITDGDHQAPPQADSGVPFITISAMNDGKLRLEKASRFVPQAYFDSLKPSRRPARGDLLFSVTGSIGIPAQVDTDEPFTFQRHIAILKPNKSSILSSFIALALGSKAIRAQVMEVATGTAQLTIPLSGIRNFVVNLPPIAEQAEIVLRVETLFTLADRIEARATAARAHAQRLSPLVLAKAFRGELVPQDPSDEPAAELLRRVAESRPAPTKKARAIRTDAN